MSSPLERSRIASVLKGAGALLRSADAVRDGVPDQFDLRQHGFTAPSTDQGRTDRCSAYAVAGAAACWAAVHELAATVFLEDDLFLRGDRQPDLERMLVAARSLGLVANGAGECDGDGCSRRARCGTHDPLARRIDYRILVPSTKQRLRREMRETLAVLRQPILARIRVSNSFREWSGGRPYEPLERGSGRHAVCIIGYRNDADPDHDGTWIIRNSYGPDWGDAGCFEAYYGDSNLNLERWLFALSKVHSPGVNP